MMTVLHVLGGLVGVAVIAFYSALYWRNRYGPADPEYR